MYYEINVSKAGKHFFATAERSITSMSHLQDVYPEIAKKFPASEGYEITVTKWFASGKVIDITNGVPIE